MKVEKFGNEKSFLKLIRDKGKDFTIVHQYDRIPEWRKIIEEKYND